MRRIAIVSAVGLGALPCVWGRIQNAVAGGSTRVDRTFDGGVCRARLMGQRP